MSHRVSWKCHGKTTERFIAQYTWNLTRTSRDTCTPSTWASKLPLQPSTASSPYSSDPQHFWHQGLVLWKTIFPCGEEGVVQAIMWAMGSSRWKLHSLVPPFTSCCAAQGWGWGGFLPYRPFPILPPSQPPQIYTPTLKSVYSSSFA